MAESPRIGVLGGTFNPIHIGHLVAAVNVRFACRLDKVLMVLAPAPWQKADRSDLLPAELRFQALSAAVESAEGLVASRIDLDRDGPTFTVDTLTELHDQHPGGQLFLILGDDAAERLPTWHRPERVAEMAELVVVNRGGSPQAEVGPEWRVHRVDMPPLDISSTDIRRRIAEGLPVDFLVPEPALAVLQRERAR